MEGQVYLVSEAARRLGLAASTLRKLADRGELKATRTAGGTRIFSSDDLNKFKAHRAEKKSK